MGGLSSWARVGLFCLLAGCSLSRSSDDFTFGGDAAVDATSDATADGEVDGGECAVADDCPTQTNTVVSCETSACVYLCADGWDDCDDGIDGCETPVDEDPSNCGSCGNACAAANAAPTCVAAECGFDACNMGFASCDDVDSNGCEADLRGVETCGACDAMCSTGQLCDASSDPISCANECTATECGTSCVDTGTDVAHCGGCDSPCPTPERAASITCAASVCDFACMTGFANCDGEASTGCNINTVSDPMNCGGCTTACGGGEAVWGCEASACTVASCNMNFDDCDGVDSTGCEADLRADTDNCGTCGVVCGGGECIGGVCDPVIDGDSGVGTTCLLRLSGEFVCWGKNEYRQSDPSQYPRDVDGPATFLDGPGGSPFLADDVAVGYAHACAVHPGGVGVSCWGHGIFGQIGDGDTATQSYPSRVISSDGRFATRRFSAVDSNLNHSCVVDRTGDVWCWGLGVSGQLGVVSAQEDRAVRVAGLPSPATAIAVGEDHSCAVLDTRLVYCWGSDSQGQLGNGAGGSSTTPVQVLGLTDVRQISAYWKNTCVIDGSQRVHCWGDNTSGQAGPVTPPGAANPITTPYTSVDVSGATGISVGYLSTCAATTSGAFCWGRNSEGQWGDGTLTPGATDGAEVRVPELDDFSELIAGQLHRCGARADGTVACWGRSQWAQVPRDTLYARTPTDLVDAMGSSPASFSDISADLDHACGIEAGLLYCWGANGSGQLGLSTATFHGTPQRVPGLLSVVSIDTGHSFTCGVGSTGAAIRQAQCWGTGAQGRLGSPGGTSASPRLVNLTGSEDEVVTGASHACARQGGDVYCWGQDIDGATGHAGTSPAAAGVSDALELAAGHYHTCARRGGTQISCWGRNTDGQLGDGTGAGSSTPVTFDLPAAATKITAGVSHSCALAAGFVYCWGDNEVGQIGSGASTDAMTPVSISLPMLATDIAAGMFHTCAVLADGSLYCWGEGTRYELADGVLANHLSPIEVLPAGSAIAVDAGLLTTFVTTSAGNVQAAGSDQAGVTGTGSTVVFPSPSPVALP